MLKIRACFRLILTLSLCAFMVSYLGGCARVIHATTSEPVQINNNKRSLGTKLNDDRLETYARVNLLKADPAFEDARVNIDSFNGFVLLTGQVPTEHLRQIAGNTVGAINSVRQVHNELQVGPQARFGSQSLDAWITTKIKSRLVASSIQSRRVHIITEAQTVFLMGLVSRNEADRIAEVARTSDGVQQVVKVFEYLD
ncbi:BON domain-containing protein [Cellvibrio mixtus]|uniref:BON domain-containing protein n=1 Tax=Cellvibrio mixtus TaxID=39650 RepID=UPI000586AD13|nr:BON domain-containing protein [Cellvibrio mixtus]